MNLYPLLRHSCSCSSIRAIGSFNGEKRAVTTATFWEDEKPYEILPGGEKSYFDEQDVVTFLDPPREPKKIDDIPAERRLRLSLLLKPRLYFARIESVTGDLLIDDHGQEKAWKMNKQTFRKRKSQIATVVEDALCSANISRNIAFRIVNLYPAEILILWALIT